MTSVFLVDDHALMRDGLRALLSANGYLVAGEAGSVDKAIEVLRELQPDLLLLDLNLGDASGLELQEWLRRHRLSTRTIVLTIGAQAHQAAEARRLGAEGFVFKDASSQSLLQAMVMVMRGNHAWDPRALDLLERAGQASPMGLLSPREIQILQLVVRGQTSAAIAERLFLSPKTVDTYRSRLMAKLEVNDVPGLVRLAIREGLIGLEDA